MQVIWSEGASRDLEELGDYLASHDRVAARKLVRRIAQAVSRLRDSPFMARSGRVEGTRELVVSGTSYIVPYRVVDGRCEILAVFHSSREWPEVF